MKAGKGSFAVGKSSSHRIAILSALLALCAMPLVAEAGWYGHPDVGGPVWVPAGAAAFADVVTSYNPNIETNPGPDTILGTADDFDVPVPAYRVPGDALGVTNYDGHVFGTPYDTGEFVSLGNGGDLVLQFTDVLLSPNGNSSFDLYIFEVGDLMEATDVWISKTGNVGIPADWFYVGRAQGSQTRGIDIDAYAVANGWTTADQFGYVRLQDVYSDAYNLSIWAGADIDAVAVVPEPATMTLLALGGTALLWAKRRRTRA